MGGTFLNLGDFHQCLAIRRSGQLIGKYFLINLVPLLEQPKSELSVKEFRESSTSLQRRFAFLFQFPDMINVKLGLCLPKTCANAEVQQLFNQTANRFRWKVQKQINSQTSDSLLTRMRASSWHVQIAFLVLALLLTAVLVATVLDLVVKLKPDSAVRQFVECTSIRSNFVRLHSASEVHSKTNEFISKNRYYSEILVNITHFIVFIPLLGNSVIYEHVFDWIEYSEQIQYQFFFCDCYYPGLVILASTTVSLKMWSFIQRKAAARELAENVFKRMLNFWPILIVLICIQIAQPLLTQGPLVPELIEPVADNCKHSWWLNLLFIHNIQPIERQCLAYTWTVSSELQLYLIASLLTYLYIRKPRLAIGLNILLIAIGVLANAYVSFTGLTRPNVMSFPYDYNSIRRSIFYSHSNTIVQLSPYFAIFLAFYLRLSKQTFKLKIVSSTSYLTVCLLKLLPNLPLSNQKNETLITIALFFYSASAYHSSILFNVLKVKPNPLLNMIFYLYNRLSFMILSSWLILVYFPNGTPSRKDEMMAWLRGGRNEKSSSLLLLIVNRLNRSLYDKDEGMNENGKNKNELKDELKNELKVTCAKRKVSSSESTSDLSDYSLQPESSEDRNNNFGFYDRRLIDLPEDRLLDRQLTVAESKREKTSEERQEINKRPRKSVVQIWPKLSRSIYYSHYFYLLYACFNVNGPQRSDMLSMVSELKFGIL